MQQQVLFNTIKIGISTLGSFGAVFILWKISPTITSYFTWQIIINGLFVALLTILLWRSLPSSERRPVFNPGLLRNISHFAIGMSGIALSGIILTQMDKIILSKLLSLEMFGYYTLAGVASGVIPFLLVSPVFNALFPRFTSLVAVNDEIALRNLYHQGSQLMTVLVLPVAALLAFFSYDLLLLWTGSSKTAGMASPIVSVLVIGMALNALMTLPYALQLSHGWTSIGLRINIFLIILLVPAVYFMATHFGAIGAASVWVVLNSIYMLLGVPLTHKRLLQGEMLRWFGVDVIPPLIATLIVTGIGRWLMNSPLQPIMSIVNMLAILLTSLTVATLTAPEMRNWLSVHLLKVRSTLI